MSIFNRALLAKVEVTKGTDSMPVAGTNDIQVMSVSASPTAETIDNAVVKATMGNKPHLIGRKTIEVAIDANMKGSGVAGTAPEIGALMQACGLQESVSVGVSVAYAPASITNRKSVSAYVYNDGQVFKSVGAVGNLSIEATMNAAIKSTFSLKAGFDIAPASAVAPIPSVNATQPIVMTQASAITESGTSINVGSFSMDLGNEFGDHNTTGQNEFTISNRAPTLSITKDSLETAADWNALVNATSISLSATFGTVAGNTITITAANARLTGMTVGERNEVNTHELSFNLYESTGDDQFSIVFA